MSNLFEMTLEFTRAISLILQESLTSVDILKLARLVRIARLKLPNGASAQVLAEDGPFLPVLGCHPLSPHGLLLPPRPLAGLPLVRAYPSN